VAEYVLAAIEASEQGSAPLRAFIAINREDVMRQAGESAARIQAGEPLSLLDGVPVAVKDEIDMLPYPTTVGTLILGRAPAARDASIVARLRAAGALLIGKTNMHEIGIAPNGQNAHYGVVRNPFNDGCDSGGSSSGSAAAVAAGLVPVAIGADGGGSIRVPAALCGVVGLKSTFGRVSEAGAAPLCWSVAHLGPLAACVEDAALVYSLIAGPDPNDSNTLIQPPVTLADGLQPNLQGLRLGIDRAWFEHASPGVVHVCRDMVKHLRAAGAEICEIVIPNLNDMRVAHAVTILSEMAQAMAPHRRDRKKHGDSVRLNLLIGEAVTAQDYLQAQQIRARALHTFEAIFKKVDIILSPATALTAQPIPAGGIPDGWSDLGTDTEMMRYVFPGNLVGLPAISFPAGYDEHGMPVGMQAMGSHWQEHLLFRVAYAAEQVVERRCPARYYPVF
jgi:Asp-tRNA(Asn)/Glu-tRNA(Gln) amidotransferase A subunit family amidase